MKMDNVEWHQQALCAEIGGDWWFPEDNSRPEPEVLKVCGRCPVQAECLEFALENNEKYGVWGGLSPNKRKLLRRERVA
jgi:WhiB family redox-sensing transcriptional regulator